MLIYLKKIIPITLVLIAVVCLPVSAKVLLNYDFDNNVGTLGTVGIQRNTEKAVAEVRKAEDGNLFAHHVLDAIVEHVAPVIQKRNHAMAAAVAKHTAKYEK